MKRFQPMERRTGERYWRQRVPLTELTKEIVVWTYRLRVATLSMLSAVLERRVKRTTREDGRQRHPPGRRYVLGRQYLRRDSYLEEKLRKMFDTRWIGKLPGPLNEPDVYALTGQARRGRQLIRELFGNELRLRRRLATRSNKHLGHLLEVAWARVFLHLACRGQGYRVLRVMDDLDLEAARIGRIPDLAVVFEKREGRRGFLIEVERLTSTRRTLIARMGELGEFLRRTEELETLFGTPEMRLVLILSTVANPDPTPQLLSIKAEIDGMVERGLVLLTTNQRLFGMDARELFTSPIFFQTGRDGRHPIYLSPLGGEIRFER